ncbi:hypothetical protein [Cupriavidus necator]|uniref:hypothetical protein n=1 Tax=Cupriavidus necator TaxID=106590 RepID=UPI0038B3F18A
MEALRERGIGTRVHYPPIQDGMDVEEPGGKFNLTDVNAAVGLVLPFGIHLGILDKVYCQTSTTVLTTTRFSGRSTGTVQGKQVARRQAPIATW